MLLTNLKAQNVTFVNGDEIMSKRVDANSQVALGKDRFAINISQILSVVTKMLEVIDSGSHGGGSAHVNGGSKVITGGGGKEPIYSIKHLEYVWNDYNENLKKIRKRQRKLGLMSSIPMGFTMLGGCIVAFVPEIRPIAGAFTAVAFALFLISIFLRANDKSIDEEEQLKKRLEDNYVCPNPKCHCFVGNQSYNLLRKRKNCPICKCLWTEE